MSLDYKNYTTDVHRLVQAALHAADPATAVSKHLRKQNKTIFVADQPYTLQNGRIYLISVGKAALPMMQAAIQCLEDVIHAGICITKENKSLSLPNLPDFIQHFAGEHPVAGEESVAATTAVSQLLSQTAEKDLVICLISGGCSALLTKPILPLTAWQSLNNALLASGCSINDFNTVRRRLDAAKGGGLARWAAPAQVATLILSDVIGNDLKAIGSGPTVFTDETTAAVTAVLEQYQIQNKVSAETWNLIKNHLQATPGNQAQTVVRNSIIGDVRIAAKAMAQEAETLGFTTTILTTHLEGEAKEAGQFAAAIAKDMQPATCIILGGETTVTIKGNGIGGRNLEVALSAAIGIDNLKNCVIFTLATDGDDGPTRCAGAMVCGESLQYGRNQNLKAPTFLHNNDSYTYFHQLDNHLLVTGQTGTNVNDLICILRYPT